MDGHELQGTENYNGLGGTGIMVVSLRRRMLLEQIVIAIPPHQKQPSTLYYTIFL
jgi:D-arabinose 1-dehydrogenase-like Zn-dependent alcohol dehydrogenase